MGNQHNLSMIYEGIAAIYTKKEDHAKALEQVEHALQINIEISSRNGQAVNYLNIGAISKNMGN